ncbi:ABC transporter ATP-binding protein [Paenibacillus ginsengarvi]|uniref:ABC transporter ATP-binding protein n=1 Tax=Paenibacillus ginsengarvi TaxID=400777 RepID=A0A3B0CJK9_9BACL|nr:ABC transporter ATP-binding protein [Paenibacillus ginsengarvi]RKN84527.1 ABC transporter ATP-binding protein [Paenibacillus ginsengarvi]
MAIIQVNHLKKSYGDREVISDVSFRIEDGECVALLGPNGAGKTTIIKMLLDITKPTGGQILFQGERHDRMRQHIGYLPQHPTFYSWMTGKELLEYMGELSGIDKKHLEQRMDELLDLVGLSREKDKQIGTYSGGMKQRLGIAQALIHRPKLLIMDEPVSAMDPLGRRNMMELLKVIKLETTILFSTHILHDAEELCDNILILNQGKLLVNDSIAQVTVHHQQPVFIIQAPRVKEWVPLLANNPIVESIDQSGTAAKIRVTNIDQGRDWLLDQINQMRLPVQKFELVQESLEDIFLRMVK